ncbi:MAG: PAS domain S-box protein [Candidatus Hydrogenedentes bacterium]|nr:PAS domain S-box protein [Candidatus Hydrogenedentota bacterium]
MMSERDRTTIEGIDLMALFRRGSVSESPASASPASRVSAPHPRDAQSAPFSIDAYVRSYDTSPDAVTVTDASGTIRYVNPAFTILTGYAASEVLGRTPRMLKSGKHDGFFYASLWRHLLAGHTWRGEIVNRRKDGALYVDQQVITPIKQTDRTISGFISVRHDRTQESQAEAEAARRAEELAVAGEIESIGRLASSSKDVLEKAVALLLSLRASNKS